MSRESLTWLNTNTLIGFTDKRGTAWHWRAEEQGEQSNHYPGPIPISDVQERLFHWTADSRRIAVEVPAEASTTTHSRDGLPMRWAVVQDRQVIGRSDDHTGNVMGIFGHGYQRHQYREWLLISVADLLDDDLAISSAGLLRGGAIAWVEVSMPETITTPEGVAFRPNLLARTSFDGSISTPYKRTVTDTVCDNTRACALAEKGQDFKVKHTANSRAQLGPARQALDMVHTLAQDFAYEVAQLCADQVSGSQWASFLDSHVPRVDPRDLAAAHRTSVDPGGRQAGHPVHPLPLRPTSGPLGRDGARGPSGDQHLRAPRRHRPRQQPHRTQRAEDHQRGLRPTGPHDLDDAQGSSGQHVRSRLMTTGPTPPHQVWCGAFGAFRRLQPLHPSEADTSPTCSKDLG